VEDLPDDDACLQRIQIPVQQGDLFVEVAHDMDRVGTADYQKQYRDQHGRHGEGDIEYRHDSDGYRGRQYQSNQGKEDSRHPTEGEEQYQDNQESNYRDKDRHVAHEASVDLLLDHRQSDDRETFLVMLHRVYQIAELVQQIAQLILSGAGCSLDDDRRHAAVG